MENKNQIIITVILFSVFLISFSSYLSPNTAITGNLPATSTGSIAQGIQNLFEPVKGLINGFVGVINSFIGNSNSKVFLIIFVIFIFYYLTLSSKIFRTIFGEEQTKKFSLILSIVFALITFFSIKGRVDEIIYTYSVLLGVILNYLIYGFTFYLTFKIYSGKGFFKEEGYSGSVKFFFMMLTIILGYLLIGFTDNTFLQNTGQVSLLPWYVKFFVGLFNVFLTILLLFSFVGVVVNITHVIQDFQFSLMKKKADKTKEIEDLKLEGEQNAHERDQKRKQIQQDKTKQEMITQKTDHDLFFNDVERYFGPMTTKANELAPKMGSLKSIFVKFTSDDSIVYSSIPNVSKGIAAYHQMILQDLFNYHENIKKLFNEYNSGIDNIDLNTKTANELVLKTEPIIFELKKNFVQFNTMTIKHDEVIHAIIDYLSNANLKSLEFLNKNYISVDTLHDIINQESIKSQIIKSLNDFLIESKSLFDDIRVDHNELMHFYNSFLSKYKKTIWTRFWTSLKNEDSTSHLNKN